MNLAGTLCSMADVNKAIERSDPLPATLRIVQVTVMHTFWETPKLNVKLLELKAKLENHKIEKQLSMNHSKW